MAQHGELPLSPRLNAGKDAKACPRAVEVAIQHGSAVHRNPVGPPPSSRYRTEPPTFRPRGAGISAHGDWYGYPDSDDFAGCWA